jgi:hypothetical protein
MNNVSTENMGLWALLLILALLGHLGLLGLWVNLGDTIETHAIHWYHRTIATAENL